MRRDSGLFLQSPRSQFYYKGKLPFTLVDVLTDSLKVTTLVALQGVLFAVGGCEHLAFRDATSLLP